MQRAVHSKRVARRKPIPKNRKVKVGVMFVFMQAEPRGHTQKRTQVSAIRPTQLKKPEAYKPEAYSGTY